MDEFLAGNVRGDLKKELSSALAIHLPPKQIDDAFDSLCHFAKQYNPPPAPIGRPGGLPQISVGRPLCELHLAMSGQTVPILPPRLVDLVDTRTKFHMYQVFMFMHVITQTAPLYNAAWCCSPL